jgi:hypothetical protein
MSNEQVNVKTTVSAPAETVFAVLADPSSHQAIDGTGWVREPLDGKPLAETGQVFRMAMYHDNHPDKDYEMANRVVALEAPRVIAWESGQANADGEIEYGGWIWRYDLEPVGADRTDITLSYDWSGVPQQLRAEIEFPPFPLAHLENSLSNLSGIASRET